MMLTYTIPTHIQAIAIRTISISIISQPKHRHWQNVGPMSYSTLKNGWRTMLGQCWNETTAQRSANGVGPMSGNQLQANVQQFTLNPLTDKSKTQSNGPLYSNTLIGTLAVDWYAVTFGTKCNSIPINGQCTNFILFNVALNECKYVAGTWRCVVCPLEICVNRNGQIGVHTQAPGRGARGPVPHSWWCQWLCW